MTLSRARILRDAGTPTDERPTVPKRPLGARRIPRGEVEAHERAERIVADARALAAQALLEAATNVDRLAEVTARETREREIARVAAQFLSASVSDERALERRRDQLLQVAVVLAERLLGEALALEPTRIATFADAALRETRGARRIRIEACPTDVTVLTQLLAGFGTDVVSIEPSDMLQRGSLLVHTELGTIDARLPVQLARLAEALKDVLHTTSIGDPEST